ncbi:VacJ family lipoprotein [Ramlibacter monticola]|uniref:VacJ family lipoprotein n=1 Tax=Ramlibacter monticola TaxID=1926872 RepID=A0A936YX85_9BURK|nr:VacJ family lipoprotein [Ramlibacter monticola]MBL0389590.1 VacJ family lipoprotein [Ramlibacter monticola]
MRQPPFRAALLAPLLLLAGCATVPFRDPDDPLESFNREVNSVNRGVDQAALKPAAEAYEHGVPRLVRAGVSNFLGNLGDPWSAVNSLLQLKAGDAAQDTMRFAVNTFFGLGGVLDIATDAGMERHKQDFGNTLAHWGVPAGPYLVLPILGPSTLRDTVALPADWFGDPLRFVAPVMDRNALVAGRTVDVRARMLAADPMLDGALDCYTFMRDAYLQLREAQVHGTHAAAEDAPPTDAAEGEGVQTEGRPSRDPLATTSSGMPSIVASPQ